MELPNRMCFCFLTLPNLLPINNRMMVPDGYMQYDVPEAQDLEHGEEFAFAVRPDKLTLCVVPIPLVFSWLSPFCCRSIDVSTG